MKNERRRYVLMSALGGALLLAASIARATTSPGPAATPVDPTAAHTMFMGLDLTVPYEGKNLPILDAGDDALIAANDGQQVRIPTSGRNVRLQVNHALKLSEGAATLEGLAAKPGYSLANDPFRKFESAAAGASSVGAAVDITTVGVRGAEITYAVTTGILNTGAYAPGAESAQKEALAIMTQATSDMVAASQAGGSDQYQAGAHAQKLNEELAEGNFDALDIEFTISSPEQLSAPWIAVLMKYRDRDRPQEDVKTWIVTKALAPIGSQATRVRFKQTGLPLGFRMESYQVHLYNKGVEIATTEAPMRTVISAEEAFQFRVVDYVTSHAEATLPAAPAEGQVSDTLRSHLTTQYANKPVYVRVLPTGRADGIYKDKACKTPVEDARLDSILSAVRFNPALEKGKPVRGVVMLVGKPS